MSETAVLSTKTCGRCGATIHLVQAGQSYKWVTDPRRDGSWHCGNDPLFPVQAHAPQQELSPRG